MRLTKLSSVLPRTAYSKTYDLLTLLGLFPATFRAVTVLRGEEFHRRIANKDTDVVIEGFPRSGNTFAVVAFRFFRVVSGEGLSIAHHLHMPAQVILAERYRLPCMVQIRKPIDAVASLMLSKPLLTGAQALRSYARFYARLEKHRDAFVVAPFEEVTRHFDRTIERLNARFGTKFETFVHSNENVEKCFARMEWINNRNFGGDITQLAKPNNSKNALKNDILNELRSKRLAKHLENAEAVYREFVG